MKTHPGSTQADAHQTKENHIHLGVLLWALAWTAMAIVVRYFTIATLGSDGFVNPLPFLLSVPFHLIFGFMLAVLVCSSSDRKITILGWVVAAITMLFNFGCYFYESYFGRLPGVATLFYLGEFDHLTASVEHNAPWPALVLIWLGALAILFYLARQIRTRNHPARQILLLSVFVLNLILVSLSFASPNLIPERYFWKSRSPMGWLVNSVVMRNRYQMSGAELTEEDIWQFQRAMGHPIPFGAEDPAYPLCSKQQIDTKTSNDRSVILLILEGVSAKELEWKLDGQPVMPNLSRIAAENIHFVNHFASGTKSCHALPSLLAGIPPQTVKNYLWTVPPLTSQSFVSDLARSGYATSYFHGSDLSFEQQRFHLRRWGFKEVFELSRDKDSQVFGWGYDDGAMLRRLRSWISKQRETEPDGSYFTTLFTLSTHDPYVLPSTWKPVFAPKPNTLEYASDWRALQLKNSKLAMADSYRFLDTHLGEFFDWFEANEKPKGTILMMVGDHAPHYFYQGQNEGNKDFVFRVPLIIAGNMDDVPPDSNIRLAGQHDVPATIAGLLERRRTACDQGKNLLQRNVSFSDDRIVYAVSGDNLEKIYLWSANKQVVANRRTGTLSLISEEVPKTNTKTDDGVFLSRVKNFIGVMTKVNAFVHNNNAYAPLDEAKPPRKPIQSGPLIVASHRGNTEGPAGPGVENTLDAIERAVAAGFEWVEVDVRITRDGVPILLHDEALEIEPGKGRSIYDLTLADLETLLGYRRPPTLEEALDRFGKQIRFLVESKPSPHISQTLVQTREIARIIAARKHQTGFIVDGFSRTQVLSIGHLCDGCETAIDAPFRQPVAQHWLEFISELGIHWIYIHQDVFTPKLLLAAHKLGLKVMVYTVNDPAGLTTEAAAIPDGIITDHRSVLHATQQL